MAHMYRGEMNRMMTYRQRLDTTLQYSVMISSSMLVFYFSTVAHPNFPLMIVLYLWVFLLVEARRYRYFLLSRSRVRWFERVFFLQKAVQNTEPSMESLAVLMDHERLDRSVVWWRCIGIRLCRYYLWLIDVVLFGWWLRVHRLSPGWFIVSGFHALLHLLVPFLIGHPDF